MQEVRDQLKGTGAESGERKAEVQSGKRKAVKPKAVKPKAVKRPRGGRYLGAYTRACRDDCSSPACAGMTGYGGSRDENGRGRPFYFGVKSSGFPLSAFLTRPYSVVVAFCVRW